MLTLLNQSLLNICAAVQYLLYLLVLQVSKAIVLSKVHKALGFENAKGFYSR